MRKYLLILFCLLLGSFKSEIIRKDNTPTYTVNLDTKLELPLVSADYFSWYSAILYIEDIPYLFRENNMYGNMQVFDLSKKKLEKEIVFKSKGSNSIRSAFGIGFHPFSLDTIALVNQKKELFLMNNAYVLEKYNMDFQRGNRTISTQNDTKLLRLNDSLYGMAQFKSVSWYENEYLETSPFAIYDFKNYKIHDANFKFPSLYKDKCWIPEIMNPAFTLNIKTQKVVVSYPASHNLLLYDFIKDKTVEVELNPTKYFDEIKSRKVCNQDRPMQESYFLDTAQYLNIIYDKYRDVYYRFFQLPLNNSKIATGNLFLYKQLGFVVLGADFKIINQTLLERNRFLPHDYFLTKEGLWISNNHPDNPDFDDKKLKFSLIELIDN